MSTPAYVQSAIINDASSGATTGPVSLTGTGANCHLVLGVSSASSAGVSSISSTPSLTWTKAGRQGSAGGAGVEIWYALNAAGGNVDVTVTWAASDAGCLALVEYSNPKNMIFQVADVSIGANATSTTPTATTATTTYADEVVVCCATWDTTNPTATAGTGFTSRQQFTDAGITAPLVYEDKTVTATGTQTGNWTLSGSIAWAVMVATFKGSTAPTQPKIKQVITGNGTGTPAVLTFATAPTADNLLVAGFAVRGEASASLSGWTQHDFVGGASAGNIGLTVLYRVAVAGDGAGTSFVLSSGQRWGGYKMEIVDFNNSAAAAWDATHTTSQNTGSRTTDTTDSITPAVDNCLILAHFGIATGAVTGNAPSGIWTERADVSNTATSTGGRLVAHSGQQDTAAAITDTLTWSASTSATGCDQAMSIAPAPSATGDVTVTPAQVTLALTLQAPTVSAQRFVTVSPALLTATLTLQTPAISILTVARPVADISAGGWTTDTGATTNLFDAINETTANDSDYIRSGLSPVADASEVSLGTLADPGTDIGFKVRYRYGKDQAAGEQINLTVALVQGTTTIASWVHTDVSDTLATVTQTLSAPEAAAITNFADVRLRFTASAA